MSLRSSLLISLLLAVAALAAGCGTATNAAKPAPPPTSAGKASQWKVAHGANQAVDGWLDGVDCVTAADCVAVGNELTSAGPPGKALAETWHEGSWSSSTLPAAPGGHGDYLFSVSCPSVGSCVAVGYFFAKTSTGGNGKVLIETLANGSWTVTPTPGLGSADQASFLNGVSCLTATDCVAVGNTSDGGLSTNQPLILSLAGGTWSVTSGPSLRPVGGLLTSGVLQAVQCTGPTACMATGYRATNDSTWPLTESLTGAGWSVIPSPGAGGPSLENGVWGDSGLACTSPTTCVAVGRFPGGGPIVATMTDRRWAETSSPKGGTRDDDSGLYGVSCPSTTCVAVGDVEEGLSPTAGDGALGLPRAPLIETYAGGRWTADPGPRGLAPDSGLHAVSCAGQTCVAVGQSGQFATSTSVSKTLIIQTR